MACSRLVTRLSGTWVAFLDTVLDLVWSPVQARHPDAQLEAATCGPEAALVAEDEDRWRQACGPSWSSSLFDHSLPNIFVSAVAIPTLLSSC